MEDLTEAYENGAHIPDADGYRARWPVDAAAFRDRIGAEGRARLDIPYGKGERQRYDLFLPEAVPKGLVVFVHGGYWRMLDRTVWSHLAAGPVAAGWAVALPSYTLAPAARITEMTREVAAAVAAAAGEVAGPIAITGHSAGGHLSARMRCRDVALPAEVEARIARVLPISPLTDLRPLMQTDMNADLRLDAEEAAAESPALNHDLRAVDTHIWVGEDERTALLDQARWLADAWPDAGLTIDPGKHHFDVVEGLEAPDGALTRALLDGM